MSSPLASKPPVPVTGLTLPNVKTEKWNPLPKIDNYDRIAIASSVALGILLGFTLVSTLPLTPGWIVIAASGIFVGLMGCAFSFFRRVPLTPQFAKMGPYVEEIVDRTPKFNDYKIDLPKDKPISENLKDLVLTGLSIRPSNLFFQSMLGTLTGGKPVTTMPGESPKLFAFEIDHAAIADHIQKKSKTNEVVKFSALGVKAQALTKDADLQEIELEDVLGKNEYQISYKEVQETLDSQKIYVSSLLPLEFYRGFKAAMQKDEVVELRFIRNRNGTIESARPAKLNDLLTESKGNVEVARYLNAVKNQPLKFGFKSINDFNQLLALTTYQIGSMVVKSEDFHVFVDGDGKIIKRNVGDQDAIRLLNACGIRPEGGLPPSPLNVDQKIMKETFKTALAAAGSGMVVMPAVGMGVWGGNPEIYWTAFLEAVIESKISFDAIFINPNHAPSKWPNYKGKMGEEFDLFFQKYVDNYALKSGSNPETIEKLKAVYNLRERKTDLVQLARELKKSYPSKVISLFNASDPDVTLGNHVGEYTNNMPHTTTTEENFTAMGSNGICFETITQVHKHLDRLFQVAINGQAKSGEEMDLKGIRSRSLGDVLAEMADIHL